MPDSIIDSLGASTATSPTPSRFQELTSEDFVKIMFTELSNQDPLKPNDSNNLMQQFSSLRSIESDLALQEKLESVVNQTELATAGALLGKYVIGLTDQFDPQEGVVRSISQTTDGPVLNLVNGARVPFRYVDQILNAPTTPTTTPPTSTPPTTTPPTNTTPTGPLQSTSPQTDVDTQTPSADPVSPR